jgi:hypothetical protein
VEPPLFNVLVGLTTFLEAVVTNMVEVEVMTLWGVVLVVEVVPAAAVVVVEVVVEAELEVEEERDDEELDDAAEVVEVEVDRVVSCVLAAVLVDLQ